MNLQVVRKPLFGRHGKKVVIGLCGWEVVSLLAGLPPISVMVRRFPVLGWAILGMLVHHWYLEVTVDVDPVVN